MTVWRQTLFGKILFWTVSAQIGTVATILALVTFYLPQSQEAVDNAFVLYAHTAVALLERFGPKELDKFLALTGESTLLKLKLLATNPGRICGPGSVDRGEHSIGIAVRGELGTYCLTVRAKAGDLPESPEVRRSRFQIVVLLELVCCIALSFLIARYLSRPIADLRQAARRMAQGDLTARAGTRGWQRNDEAAQLVREFDQMAERVAAAMEAQHRLIGDVSHEIKSPLARLSMALSLARRDAEQHASKQFSRMQHEIDSISRLVNELLTLASLDAAAGKTIEGEVELTEVIADVIGDIAFESPDRAPDITFLNQDGEAWVRGDRAMVRRAIENILRNAIFYTDPGVAIEIVCEARADGWAQVRIADHGDGVPDRALAHLFDPFYRVDDARARQTGGTGIGLAICRRAVELHNGRVSATNIAPHGLAVVIKLAQIERNAGHSSRSTQLHEHLT